MKSKRINLSLIASFCLLILFIAYTWMVMKFDQAAIGPQESIVGFSKLNQYVHDLFGVNMMLYNLTDVFGFLIFLLMGIFAFIGVTQLIKRKSIKLVDKNIILLGAYYVLVFSVYLFFEIFVVNYRPVLIEGILEASYPSSTTMLALCVIPVAMMQFKYYIINKKVRYALNVVCSIFLIFMVFGRILSGVHWFTDILGGILISSVLVCLYVYFEQQINRKKAFK